MHQQYDDGRPTLYRSANILATWYWILADKFPLNLSSGICGENYNLDSQGLRIVKTKIMKACRLVEVPCQDPKGIAC